MDSELYSFWSSPDVILVREAGKLKLVEQIFRNNEDKICSKLLPRRKETEKFGDDKERGAIHIYW
jgi:hypothetical protein